MGLKPNPYVPIFLQCFDTVGRDYGVIGSHKIRVNTYNSRPDGRTDNPQT